MTRSTILSEGNPRSASLRRADTALLAAAPTRPTRRIPRSIRRHARSLQRALVLAACAGAFACASPATAQPPLQHLTVAVEIGDAGTGSVRLRLPAQVFVVEAFSSLADADCLTLIFDGTEVLSASAAPGEEILVSAAVHDDIEVRIDGAEPNRVLLARLSYRVFDAPAQAGDPPPTAAAVQPAWRAE